jgi:3-hydroxyacyl-[acyl-carrier-protein] dehydratase
VSVAVPVPSSGPIFDGHFPGRPILPGVATLSLVVRALAPGRGPALSTVRSVRFRDLVAPGSTLDLESGALDDGSVRFDARAGGRLVLNGRLGFGAPPSPTGSFAVAARPSRDVPPLERLLLHRGLARLVRAVAGEADDGATCVARIPRGSGLADGSAAPALAALEAAAQTAAVWEALRRLRRGEEEGIRLGYLVALRDVTLYAATIPVEVDLFATVRLEAALPPLTHYAVEVVSEGELVVRGTIGTWLDGEVDSQQSTVDGR